MVQATVYFLARDPIYDTVKPYTLRYQPAKGTPLPRTNCKREAHEIQVEDLRTGEKNTTFDSHGFQVLDLPGQLTYDEYRDQVRVREVYYHQ